MRTHFVCELMNPAGYVYVAQDIDDSVLNVVRADETLRAVYCDVVNAGQGCPGSFTAYDTSPWAAVVCGRITCRGFYPFKVNASEYEVSFEEYQVPAETL